jgi:DNA-binding NarL/FixJ family response regulator
MKLYLVSLSDGVLEHWSKALKKYRPVKIKAINELNRPSDGIVFWDDVAALDDELQRTLECDTCRIMIFSMMPDFHKGQKLLTLGAKGYGNAMMHESHLQSACQTLEEGKMWLHPDFIAALMTQLTQAQPKKVESHGALEKLSLREREVAILLAQGMTHYEISEKLTITVRTIKAHCTSIYEKLAVKDRLALSVLLHS